MNEQQLSFKFNIEILKHLGLKMYSTVPAALAELIANAYDACATKVTIKLFDEGEKKIVVKDDGIGMTLEEVKDYFLIIGRNRREEKQESPCKNERKPTGKKGLGKLALFGIGDNIEIETTKDGKTVIFQLNWDEMMKCKNLNDYKINIHPKVPFSNEKGTTITLTGLKEKTDFSIDDYKTSISRLFDFKDTFTIGIQHNNSELIKIDAKTKYKNIEKEFEWNIDEIIKKNEEKYQYKTEIKGKIMTAKKPLKKGLQGITLFANGRMVDDSKSFISSESGHFYSYLTGWLNLDFIDDFEPDVISTDRQSIDWGNSKLEGLKDFLASCIKIIEGKWKQGRKNNRGKILKKDFDIDTRKWVTTFPNKDQKNIQAIVDILESEDKLPDEIFKKLIEPLRQLLPEYPEFHWRHLDTYITDNLGIKQSYEVGNYASAVLEAVQIYIEEVRKKSGDKKLMEGELMRKVWGGFTKEEKEEVLSLRNKKYEGITEQTLNNIQKGQSFLSQGMVFAVRHPKCHQSATVLKNCSLFTEKDCLDFLSLLSHLFRRLRKAEKVNG